MQKNEHSSAVKSTPKYFILASLARKKEKMDPFFFHVYIFILETVSKPGYKIYTTERKREREGSEKGVGRAVVNTNIWLNSG